MFTSRPATTMTFFGVAPSRSAYNLVVGQRLHSSRRQGVGGDRDVAADLAVDLHRVLDGVLDEVLRVGHRERAVGQGLVVAEPLPQLLGEVRRQRSHHQHQGLHHRPRRDALW